MQDYLILTHLKRDVLLRVIDELVNQVQRLGRIHGRGRQPSAPDDRLRVSPDLGAEPPRKEDGTLEDGGPAVILISTLDVAYGRRVAEGLAATGVDAP